MGYRYKWKASKTAKREFANKMQEIDDFCYANGITSSRTNDSYYFTIDGVDYRVSNHTVEASNRGAFNEFGEQVRELYHNKSNISNVVYITASKTRIIEIYNNLKNGFILDKRGNIKK